MRSLNTKDDFVVNGEGQRQYFSELVNTLNSKNNNFGTVQEFLTGDGDKIVHNNTKIYRQFRQPVSDNRETLLGLDTYTGGYGVINGESGLPIVVPIAQTQIWTRKVRYRSLTNVVEEIKYVHQRYGTRQFTFKDDSFTVNRKRVMEFCNMLMNEGIKINWDCNTRVDLVDPELLRTMKKAGCNSIKVGIESGSERILKLMDKGIPLQMDTRSGKAFSRGGDPLDGLFYDGYTDRNKGRCQKP